MKNWFQEKIVVTTVAAPMPGRASGRTMRTKAPSLVQPSISAASSSS